MSEKVPEKVWVLFKRNISPGPVPFATLGPIVGSMPYVPETRLDELKGVIDLESDEYVRQVGTWKIIQRLEEQLDKAKKAYSEWQLEEEKANGELIYEIPALQRLREILGNP